MPGPIHTGSHNVQLTRHLLLQALSFIKLYQKFNQLDICVGPNLYRFYQKFTQQDIYLCWAPSIRVLPKTSVNKTLVGAQIYTCSTKSSLNKTLVLVPIRTGFTISSLNETLTNVSTLSIQVLPKAQSTRNLLVWAPIHTCFMVNVIPCDTVILSRGSWSSDSEHQPSIEGDLQQPRHNPALLIIRQVSCSICSVIPLTWIRMFLLCEFCLFKIQQAIIFGKKAYSPHLHKNIFHKIVISIYFKVHQAKIVKIIKVGQTSNLKVKVHKIKKYGTMWKVLSY